MKRLEPLRRAGLIACLATVAVACAPPDTGGGAAAPADGGKAAPAGARKEAAGERRPNIVLILADDLGWSSLSVPMDPARTDSQSGYFETPQLERLVRRGRRFTNGYAPAAICSPTRRSIQFGQSPVRQGDERFVQTHDPRAHRRLTIPLALKQVDASYRAAHYGKWDLRANIFPEELGYDESDGDTGNDHGNVMVDRDVKWSEVFLNPRDPKRIETITRRGINFMERQSAAGRPFFLQLSHYATHVDIQTHPESFERFRDKPATDDHDNAGFAGMLYDLDAGVGEILDAIERLGIAEDTYIVFMTDNGGVEAIPPPRDKMGHPDSREGPSANTPLRGGKWTLYEGGVRVPFIVAGPGVPAGTATDVPVIGYDLLPTFFDLAGGPAGGIEDIDGGSFRAALEGDAESVLRPFDALVFHRYHSSYGHSTLREGRWKLVKRWDTERVELYDLEADLGERDDVAGSRPDVVDALHEKLMHYFVSLDAEALEGRRR